MIYNNVELHNVECLIPGKVGQLMCRVPEETRQGLTARGRDVISTYSTGVEIRFVMNGDKAAVRIYADYFDEYKFFPVQLFYGGIQAGWLWLNPVNLHNGMNEIVVDRPKNYEKLEVKSNADGNTFDPHVMRLLISSGPVEFCGVEGDVRQPEESEKPKKKILFYGSSITHGSLACLPSNHFVRLIGDMTGAEVFNKGFAGACFLEKSMCDYVASRSDCDTAVFEIGSNAYKALPDEELAARTEYLIKAYASHNPGKKFFVIDRLIPSERYPACKELVKSAVEAAGCGDAVFVSGMDLLETTHSTAADFTHPTALGQFLIAENLYRIMCGHIDF